MSPESTRSAPQRVLLVTGMSGAGKSTALKALEDIGFEAVDNMPLRLLKRLLKLGDPDRGSDRPLAVGIDARTRGFDAEDVVQRIKDLRREEHLDPSVLFIDCAGGELTRRFSETRRRHPLAQDRPATDGIAREREMLAPLRRWADMVIDTTDQSVNDLRRVIRERFTGNAGDRLTVTCMSFGFARGLPRDADLVFDMRFLANPHWQDELRPLTGRDEAVGAYIERDPAFDPAFQRIAELLALLIPRYRAEGKSYLTIAFGCTGGRHRSVYTVERMAARLREAGHDPMVLHRDMAGHGGADAASETLAAELETI